MVEKEINFNSGKYQLSGTLALPNGNGGYPAVLLIPGSGQVDRDENHKKMRINVFKEITAHLVKNGFATLRYDKRGVGKSEGDYWTTGFYDNAADSTAALKWLANREEIDRDRIFLLGHSEGAYISAMLGGRGAKAAGIILVAGGARPGEEELKWQAVQVIKGLKGFNKWLIDRLHIDPLKSQQKYLDKVKTSKKDCLRVQLFSKINAKWLREFLSYDPSGDLSKIEVPVLAVIGAKDIQVDPDNLKKMADIVNSPFEYHIVPDVTHLLRSDESNAGISSYKKQIGEPMDQRILDTISNWLEKFI